MCNTHNVFIYLYNKDAVFLQYACMDEVIPRPELANQATEASGLALQTINNLRRCLRAAQQQNNFQKQKILQLQTELQGTTDTLNFFCNFSEEGQFCNIKMSQYQQLYSHTNQMNLLHYIGFMSTAETSENPVPQQQPQLGK